MITNYKKVSIDIPENWDNITLGQYLEYCKFTEDLQKMEDGFDKVIFTYKAIEILCNKTQDEVDLLLIDEVKDVSDKLGSMMNSFNFKEEHSNKIVINDVIYVAKDVKEIDNGEYISLNILREQYKNEYELFPLMLAILVRPATVVEDKELGGSRYEVEPFSRRDIQNMKLRAELFRNNAKAKDMVPILNFFLTMIK